MRTFFSALGLLFAALVVFCASFLGTVAADIESHGPDYEKLAVDVTRELSRTWTLADIEDRYASLAREELEPVMHRELDSLKPLGELLYVDDVAVEPRWSRRSLQQAASAAAVAERIAEMINRSVRVTFTGKFSGGLADVTAELRREGKTMKLWRLRIDSREPTKHTPPPRRIISHA